MVRAGLPRRMARSTTAKILATTLLGTMDSNAIVPIIAFYAASRGAGLFMIGLIVGAYSAIHAPANLLFGRIADRLGRTRPLRLGLAWDAVSVVLYALATTPELLLLVRLGHGLGGGLVGPSTMSLASDTSRPERRGRAMALYGMSIAIAVVIGTGIANPVSVRFGFPALFYLLAAGLGVAFVISLTLREPEARPSFLRVPWRRVAERLRNRAIVAGYASIFSLYFLLGAFTALMPLYFEDLGFTRIEIGLFFFAFAALSLLLHYPAGVLADRFGSTTPAVLGLLATAVAMALLPLAIALGPAFATMALFGVGHGFVFPSASALVTRDSAPEERGVLTGAFYSLLTAGVAVGAPAMSLVAHATSIGFGIWASAWFAFIGIAFVVRARAGSRAEVPAAALAAAVRDDGP